MIPLSVIDAKIKELKELGNEGSISTGKSCSFAIYILEAIKKEATLVQPIEQKINDRIAELQSERTDLPDIEFPDYETPNHEIDTRIDELRKLLK